MARLWRLANTILGRVLPLLPSSLISENSSPFSDPEALADTMNGFFISKIEKLREGFNSSGDFHQLPAGSSRPQKSDDTLVLSPPSPADIIRAIGNLNKTGATGIDGITVSILQLEAPIIALPIDVLINDFNH